MNGKAQRAKILIPTRIIRVSSTSPQNATTNRIPANADTTRNVPILSSILQACPVIPPNEIRLAFKSEISTIRENNRHVSEPEIPKIDYVKPSAENDTIVEVQAPQRSEKTELPKSNPGNNQVFVRICKLVKYHKSGCDICSNSRADGSNQVQDVKDRGKKPKEQEPFFSYMSFNQEKGGPTLRSRKIFVSILEGTEEDSTMKSNWDEKDAEYSGRDSKNSDEEFDIGIPKCVWMEAHMFCCVNCNPVNSANGGSSREDQKRTTRQKNAEHICRTCSKNFARKDCLDIHVLAVHEKKKPYVCSICAKTFGRKNNLDLHILTVHEKKKPHACTKCDKSFGRKSELNQHLQIHDGERPFTCPECNKSFARKETMTTHLKIHTGSKPFSCNYCLSAFKRSSNLTAHMRTHSKEKPFKCSSCNRDFSKLFNCRKHEKNHLPGNN